VRLSTPVDQATKDNQKEVAGHARQEEDRGQGESQARGESAQARRGRRRQDRL